MSDIGEEPERKIRPVYLLTLFAARTIARATSLLREGLVVLRDYARLRVQEIQAGDRQRAKGRAAKPEAAEFGARVFGARLDGDEKSQGFDVVSVPAGQTFYDVRVDARNTVGLDVDVHADFSRATGVALWRFTSVDPASGRLPEDPFAGFLPPNTNRPIGEGWVRYSVRPHTNLPSGPPIDAIASIVFDANPEIATPRITNTVDSLLPSSAVASLPPRSPKRLTLSWSGTDGVGAGVESYDIYVSREGAPYTRWLAATSNTTAEFEGEPGVSYRFYSVVSDHVGYRESSPVLPDALTSTEFHLTRLAKGTNPATQVVLGWESATDKVYRVSYSTNLLEGFSAPGADIQSTPPENVLTDEVQNVHTRFYRIQVLP